jgi:hypothetical protein
MSISKDEISDEKIEDVGKKFVPVDLDDPHRAALEDNPEHAEKLSVRLVLAVIVRALSTPP